MSALQGRNGKTPGPRARPAADQRAAAQRERILAAARQCFIDKGFHGASMASIAETAGMSPGLMYRYFPSKNAIVLAIIDRQLAHSRERIRELAGVTELPAAIVSSFEQWRAGDPATMPGALFLETSAEGSRDAQIGAALRATDRQMRADLAAWFESVAERAGNDPAGIGIATRTLLLQCLLEGLAIRVIREPDLDLKALEPGLRLLTDQLLS